MNDSKFEIVDEILKKYTGTDKEVIIPEGVVELDRCCFVDAHFMETIKFPSTLKKSGYSIVATDYAGYKYALKKVYVDSLDTWLNIDFSDDKSNLLGVTNKIELFIDNKLVTDLIIPGKYKTIKANCFFGYKKLKSVTFEEGVEVIEKGAFARSGITKVVLPSSVKNLTGERYGWIFSSPFQYCENLKEINIPSSIKVLPNYFLAGSAIESIELPDSIEIIPSGCFNSCNNLKEITIPASVHTVLDAFRQCNSLTELIYPDSVHIISTMSLANIEKIILPEEWNYSGNKYWSLFEQCNLEKLKTNEYDNALYIGSRKNPYQVLIKVKNKEIETCQIHQDCEYICGSRSVASLGNMGFNGCKKIKTISIPKGIKRIESGAFSNCESLESIDLPSNYGTLDPIVYEGSTKLKLIDYGIKDKLVTFEKSVVFDDETIEEKFSISSEGISLSSTRTFNDKDTVSTKFFKNNSICSERLIAIFSKLLKADERKEEDFLKDNNIYRVVLPINNQEKIIKYVLFDEEMIRTIYSLVTVFIGNYFLINTNYKDVISTYRFKKEDIRSAIEQEYQDYNLEQLGDALKDAAKNGDFIEYEKINLLIYKLKNNGEWNQSYEE